jgi:hypothetical protein
MLLGMLFGLQGNGLHVLLAQYLVVAVWAFLLSCLISGQDRSWG